MIRDRRLELMDKRKAAFVENKGCFAGKIGEKNRSKKILKKIEKIC